MATGPHGPVEEPEQLVNVRRNQIDHPELESFGSGDRDALSNSAFGPLGVSTARLRQTADVSGGVIRDFRFDHLALTRLIARERHRMSGADIRPGSHDRNVTGHCYEETGRSGAGAVRPDENDDGNVTAQEYA